MKPRARPSWRIIAAAALVAGGCASRPNAIARPTPFPGLPVHVEGVTPTAAPTRAMPVTSADFSAAVLETALNLRGTPYRLGGTQPGTGFDCSGLVRYVFLEQRIEIPRTVAEQARVGWSLEPDEIRPGDLLFFAVDSREPTHVGLVVDQEQFIHAPGTGSVVRVERFTTPYWASRFAGARRIATAAQ